MRIIDRRATSNGARAASDRVRLVRSGVRLVRSGVRLAALLVMAHAAACLPSKGTIGAVISQDDQTGRLFLRDVPSGLAAARADLKPGDEILLIDGLDVRFMDAKQIHAALVGEVDTPVKLTLVRDEQILRVTLRRTEALRVPGLGKGALATSGAH